MASWFFYLKDQKIPKLLNEEAPLRTGKQKRLELIQKMNFNQFIEYIYIEKIPHFNRDCSFFMSDGTGKLCIDFIIKYENYEKDFIQCMKKLKLYINKESIPWEKKSITCSTNTYKALYSRESIQIVQQIYKKDIELFEYEF